MDFIDFIVETTLPCVISVPLYEDGTTGSEVLTEPDKPDLGATVFSARFTLLDAPNLNALGSVWWPPPPPPPPRSP